MPSVERKALLHASNHASAKKYAPESCLASGKQLHCLARLRLLVTQVLDSTSILSAKNAAGHMKRFKLFGLDAGLRFTGASRKVEE